MYCQNCYLNSSKNEPSPLENNQTTKQSLCPISNSLPRPYPEVSEQCRCAFPVFTAVDGSVYHADGVDAHLDWFFHWQYHFTTGETVFPVRSAIIGEYKELTHDEQTGHFD